MERSRLWERNGRTDGRTDGRTHGRTHESEFIGSFRSLKTSGEPKNNIIIKLFHKAFRKYIQLVYIQSSPQSQTSFKDMLDRKRSKFGPKGAQNRQELNYSGM